MKIAVVGSREFTDKEFIFSILKKHFTHYSHEDILISGGARGVDTLAEDFLDEWLNKIIYYYGFDWKKFKPTKIIFEPDWDLYGKRAGYLRNRLIINEADKVIAFWDGKSKGTKHSIDLAIEQGKPLDIYVR